MNELSWPQAEPDWYACYLEWMSHDPHWWTFGGQPTFCPGVTAESAAEYHAQHWPNLNRHWNDESAPRADPEG